jgi:hypothetical protein
MKNTGCIKKDVKPSVRYMQRWIICPSSVKYGNALYSNSRLKRYEGLYVLVVKDKNNLRVYDTTRKFVCVAKKSSSLPKQERKTPKKAPQEKAYTMKIYESLERIRNGKLSDMGLFELSIHSLMPSDVHRELKKRLELIQWLLERNSPSEALCVVKSLLANPQETGGKA